MGCDIHMCVERRSNRYGGGKTEWINGDYFSLVDPLDRDCRPIRQDLYDDRNYSLFAVLANVRNRGYGEEYPYIDEPRGLPDDVTQYVKDEYEAWDIDAHSCSYFTLREILEFYYEKSPRDDFGHDILNPLIERLKQRAADFFIIHEFEWGGRIPTDELYKKAENIRIIFWFDN